MTKWNDTELERGLQALVLADGRSKKAAERLAAAGEPIPERTLREWRNVHAERYAELEADRDAWTAARMADESEWLAAGYAEGEARLLRNILARPDEELQKLSPNVLAQAARNLSISRGVSIDKANELRRRPTRPDGNVASLTQLLNSIRSKFPGVVDVNPQLVESTAEEVE